MLTGIAVAASAAYLAIIGVLATASPANAMPPVVPGTPAMMAEEDASRFNCFTMGNFTCGKSPIIRLADGTEVAVPGPAEDGHLYASARDGRVFRLA